MSFSKILRWVLYFPVVLTVFCLSAWLLDKILPTLVGWAFDIIGFFLDILSVVDSDDFDLWSLLDDFFNWLLGDVFYEIIKDGVQSFVEDLVAFILGAFLSGYLAVVGGLFVAPKKLCENHVAITAVFLAICFIGISVLGWDSENKADSIWSIINLCISYIAMIIYLIGAYETTDEEPTPAVIDTMAEVDSQAQTSEAEDTTEKSANNA